MKQHDDLSPEWDILLKKGLVEPPSDFYEQVMCRVHQDAEEVKESSSTLQAVLNALQLVLALIGVLVACWQTLSFVFGLWVASAAI